MTDETVPLPESVSTAGEGVERPRLQPGQLFGRYLVVDEVGSGGVGSVYAVYDPNLDRRIALKVLRRHEPSDEDASVPASLAQKRLVKEAKALASLSHPNVVTVHDVGQHDGQTFIAMELVEGEDLSSWLRNHEGTPWQDKLRMLVDAGKGLAAAHARNVLHRDFKPANVLVGRDGWVRVSDFGLARLLDPNAEDDLGPVPRTLDDLGDSTSLRQSVSAPGRVVGTPYYMAPEQMNGEASVRSDVYAFCLSIHEALYEERLFSAATFASLAASKMAGPPSPPDDARGVPADVRRAIERGLQPRPEQRWPSMDELLSVLEESLRPQGASRWPWVLGLGGVGAAALLLASRGDTPCSGGDAKIEPIWGEARRETVQRSFEASDYVLAGDSFERTRPVLDAYAQSWSEAHREVCEATRRAEQSESLLDRKMVCLDRRLLELRATVEVLQEGKREALERAPTLASNLPDLTDCIAPASVDELAPQASEAALAVEVLLAQVDARIVAGLYSDADPLSARALDQARTVGDEHLLADALYRRGMSHNKMGRIEDAVQSLEEATWTAQRAGYGRGMIRAASLLASVEGSRAAHPEAGLRWSRYAQAEIEHTGAPPSMRATLLNNTAMIYDDLGDYGKATETYEQALSLIEEAGLDDPDRVAGLYDNLGSVARLAGNYDEAVAQHRRALAMREKFLGAEHPLLARTLSNLATALTEKGQFAEAIAIHRRALGIREKVLGPDHLDVALTLNNLAAVYYRQGDYEEAEAFFRRALKNREGALSREHPKVISALANVALALEGQGKLDEASTLYEDALSRLEARPEPSGQQLSTVLTNLGNLRAAQGRFDEAAELYERSLALDEKSLGLDHPLVAVTMSNLGNMREEQGRYDEARELHQRALKVRETKLGPDHPDLIWTLAGIAGSYQAEGRPALAIEPLERALAIGEAKTADPLLVAGVRFELAQAIWEVHHDRQRALALVRPAAEVFAAAGSRPSDLADMEAFIADIEQK